MQACGSFAAVDLKDMLGIARNPGCLRDPSGAPLLGKGACGRPAR